MFFLTKRYIIGAFEYLQRNLLAEEGELALVVVHRSNLVVVEAAYGVGAADFVVLQLPSSGLDSVRKLKIDSGLTSY